MGGEGFEMDECVYYGEEQGGIQVKIEFLFFYFNFDGLDY